MEYALYIIRHGDTVYIIDSLTVKGRLQAQALAERLSGCGLDEIYSSSANKAQLSVQPVCELFKLECEVEDWM